MRRRALSSEVRELEDAKHDSLLTKGETLARVKLTYSTVWRMMRAGTFPRARAVGARSMWLASEIDAWMAALPTRPLKGDDEKGKAA